MNVQSKIGARQGTACPGAKAFGVVARARDLAARLSEEAEAADSAIGVTPRAWQALRTSGLLKAPFPHEFGGDDLGAPAQTRDLIAVLRLIGAADLSVGRLFEGHFNAVALACRHGDAVGIAALAADIESGGFSGVWGAEDNRGLRGERDGASWRLDGRKILASGAGFVTRPLVTVGTEAGQLMMMPHLPPGTRAETAGWTAQGMRSTATGTVDFSGMVVRAEDVFGGPGDFMRQPYFSGGAWRFCAVQLGAMERLVDLFRAHLTSRGRDGDPYQIERIAGASVAVGTAALWINDTACRLAEGRDDAPTLVALANLTRMATERSALDVLELVHRGAGLAGFMRPNPIERVSRDLATYLRQPVPDLAMADAARTVLAASHSTGDFWRAEA